MPTNPAVGCVHSPPTRMLSAPTMTAQRQEAKRRRPGIAFIALSAGLELLGPPVRPSLAAVTERVTVNRYSGLAIEGFDPVAYFTDSSAMIGLPDFEAFQSGVVWRFRNEGNRASFLA